MFDLRFVPDDQSFKDRQVRDAATSVPSDYEAPTFQNKSLQHTNVELTWDKGDEGRKRALTRKLTADEIKEDDFRAYLATDSEGTDSDGSEEEGQAGGGKEDAEAIRERYRRLLLSGGDDIPKERKGKKDWAEEDGADGDEDFSGKKGSEDEDSDDEDTQGKKKNMEMEVTFTSGLEGLGDRLIAKRKEAETKAGETVWEAYMRRKREKKAEAKRLGKVNIDSDDDDSEDYSSQEESGSDGEQESDGALPAGVADDPFFQHEEDPFNDPFFQDGGPSNVPAGTTAGKKKKGKDAKGKKGGKGGDADEDGEESQRKKAELEMLLLDESALLRKAAVAAGNGGSLQGDKGGKKLSKKERMRLKKDHKRQERAGGSDDEDHEEASGAGFKVNLEDPRFTELLTAPEFALDPTDPRFAKAGPGAAVIASEVAKRRSKKLKSNGAAATEERKKSDVKDGEGAQEGRSKADLKFMVASLKRKAAVMGGGQGKAGGVENGGGKKKKGSKVK